MFKIITSLAITNICFNGLAIFKNNKIDSLKKKRKDKFILNAHVQNVRKWLKALFCIIAINFDKAHLLLFLQQTKVE